ncbi:MULTISPECIES: sensor histidine kinase [Nocardiopsis]|uniref:histidine kinase n=1 Tax=Nocardiopsis sinuspersici TaxID=501010 RepID=A0A1V3BZH7_9ACTN|nr:MULTISPECIES: histidine kinase [Nocardiopsis]OOC53951.1 histidine kinase [Nocardiopsis sinuspersici]
MRSPMDTRSARWGSPWTVAAVVALVGLQVAATVWARWGEHADPWSRWLDLSVGILACVLSPALLRWPVAGALGSAVLAVLSPAATPVVALGVLQVARRRAFPLAVAVATTAVAAHAVQGLLQPSNGISYAWWLALVAAASGALVCWGALVRARCALVMSLSERAHRAEAEQGRRVAEARMLERTRIAREMHDVLAHRLSLLATYAGALEYRPDAPPEQLSRAAGVVRTGVHQALEELREVIGVLREEDAGDEGSPQPVLTDLPRLLEEARAAGEHVDLHDTVADPAALPASTGRTAYRLAQEGLTNARKHAPGQPVSVLVEGGPGEGLVIDLRNPVPGPDGTAPIGEQPLLTPGSGTGLVGLTERVRLAGGRLDHERTREGFHLRAWLPWPP